MSARVRKMFYREGQLVRWLMSDSKEVKGGGILQFTRIVGIAMMSGHQESRCTPTSLSCEYASVLMGATCRIPSPHNSPKEEEPLTLVIPVTSASRPLAIPTAQERAQSPLLTRQARYHLQPSHRPPPPPPLFPYRPSLDPDSVGRAEESNGYFQLSFRIPNHRYRIWPV